VVARHTHDPTKANHHDGLACAAGDDEEERPMLPLSPIEPMSRHAFDTRFHGADDDGHLLE
jgi:hypothetical protein